MSENLLNLNGLNFETGSYLHSPLSPLEIRALATGEAVDRKELEAMKDWVESRAPHFGMVQGRDYKKLEETGWGVIFALEPEPGVYEALQPLLNLRKAQAAAKDETLYKEYKGTDGYLPEDTKQMFIKRHGAGGSGVVDPRKIPYYLLIVGDPETIPYLFQYQMDVQYGVGRIHFDKVEDYANYAASVVAAETGKIRLPKKAAFWGVAKNEDTSTMLSSKYLVDPLQKAVSEDQKDKWGIESFLGEHATKKNLGSLLGGVDTPAFLFGATHGMGGTSGSERQYSTQGALICQDWPGPKWEGPLRPYYYAAEDLGSEAKLGGTIAMFFACYGAGTPKFNEFRQKDNLAEPNQIAEKAFVSALPKRMLSHPNGGALAVIGHVERAWSCSFQAGEDSSQIQSYESSVKKLLDGYPVGYATEEFNSRYAELSSGLLEMMPQLKGGMKPTDEFVNLWTETYDARNFSLIGDPAVRMAVDPSASS